MKTRLTAVIKERGGETGGKNVKGLVKEHICVTHRHRQQCGEGQGEGGCGLGRDRQSGRGGNICNNVNNKIFNK